MSAKPRDGAALRPTADTINVHLPVGGLELEQVHALTEKMLNLIGCPRCFSGRNFAFLHMQDVVVNPQLDLTEIPGLGGRQF
jgi:hypothetical protein